MGRIDFKVASAYFRLPGEISLKISPQDFDRFMEFDAWPLDHKLHHKSFYGHGFAWWSNFWVEGTWLAFSYPEFRTARYLELHADERFVFRFFSTAPKDNPEWSGFGGLPLFVPDFESTLKGD